MLEPLCEGRGGGELLVVFEITADGDPVGGSTEGFEAVGVLLGLHQESRGVGKSGSQERFEKETESAEVGLPAGEGAVGDASADEEDGNFAAGGFAEEVGPDFGFEDDDEGGFGGVEDATDAEGPVEGEIDDGVGIGHAFFGEGVAGEGGGGNDQRALRIGIFEAFGERDSGESFADGDGVKPDGTGAIGGEFGEFGEGKAETFGEIGEIFVMAKPLDEPVGGGKQGGEAH